MRNTFIGNRNLVYNKRKTKHILSKNINAYDSNDKRKTHFPSLDVFAAQAMPQQLPNKHKENNTLDHSLETSK